MVDFRFKDTLSDLVIMPNSNPEAQNFFTAHHWSVLKFGIWGNLIKHCNLYHSESKYDDVHLYVIEAFHHVMFSIQSWVAKNVWVKWKTMFFAAYAWVIDSWLSEVGALYWSMKYFCAYVTTTAPPPDGDIQKAKKNWNAEIHLLLSLFTDCFSVYFDFKVCHARFRV